MGYHVKPVTSVARDPERAAKTRTWKLQWIKQENGKRGSRDIPEAEYRTHGFSPEMSIEQAQAQKRLANERLKTDDKEQKRILAAKAMTDRERAQFLFLPEKEIRAFEAEILYRRVSRGDQGHAKRNKIASHWNAAKDMLCVLKLDASDWSDKSFHFYNYFADQEMSLSYVKKVLRLVNLWGFFLCKRSGKPFLPVSAPRGMDRAHVANSHHEKRKRFKREGKHVQDASAPLTPEALKRTRTKLSPENFNWLHLSLWFGLRPDEVDGLRQTETRRIAYDRSVQKQVLWVYQPKLVALEEDDRWKAIPALYKEQERGLEIIESQAFRRPAPQTIRKYLGEEFSSYAGRKGFEHLMTSRGHPLEVVAEWMGHQSIERTWKNYRNRKRVRV